jgi:hypothetical protein
LISAIKSAEAKAYGSHLRQRRFGLRAELVSGREVVGVGFIILWL